MVRRRSENMETSLDPILNNSNSYISGDGQSRKRKMSIVKRVKTTKIIPTNFGNQIVIWAEAIYEKYGENNKLFFEGFKFWAQGHKQFIFNFRKYFRYNLWKAGVSKKTNQIFLNYIFHTPYLQDNVDILSGMQKIIKNGYAALYTDFLLVWKVEPISELPIRVLILKNIKITFDQKDNTIEFSHSSKKYKILKIKLSKISVWRFWKDTLEKYSRLNKK